MEPTLFFFKIAANSEVTYKQDLSSKIDGKVWLRKSETVMFNEPMYVINEETFNFFMEQSGLKVEDERKTQKNPTNLVN